MSTQPHRGRKEAGQDIVTQTQATAPDCPVMQEVANDLLVQQGLLYRI